MRVNFSVAARGAAVDQETNNLSIFEIVEEIQAEAFPIVLQHFAFVCAWQRDDPDPLVSAAEFSISMGDSNLVRENFEIRFHQASRDTAR